MNWDGIVRVVRRAGLDLAKLDVKDDQVEILLRRDAFMQFAKELHEHRKRVGLPPMTEATAYHIDAGIKLTVRWHPQEVAKAIESVKNLKLQDEAAIPVEPSAAPMSDPSATKSE